MIKREMDDESSNSADVLSNKKYETRPTITVNNNRKSSKNVIQEEGDNSFTTTTTKATSSPPDCTGTNNMETKGINIPTNADEQHASAAANISVKSRSEPTTKPKTATEEAPAIKEEKASDQTNATKNTTTTADDGELKNVGGSVIITGVTATTATSSAPSVGNVKLSEDSGVDGGGGSEKERIKQQEHHQNYKSDIGGGGADDRSRSNDSNPTIISNKNSHSGIIDPLGESTRGEAISSSTSVPACNNNSSKKDGCISDDGVELNRTVLLEESHIKSGGGENIDTSEESDNFKKSATLNCTASESSKSIKPPVPNFRVEGSGAGDSSVTVGIASISSSTVSAFHSGSAGTGGSNSLDNGEQSSMQSSEEMRLSLVSWYSEPDDPSRLIEGCCSALNTYRKDEDGIVEEIADHHRHHDDGSRSGICDSGSSSMGHEAVSSSAANSSPACKSDSEEKENKTPECGNLEDKISNVGDNNSREEGISNGTAFTKAELITPNTNNLNGTTAGKQHSCDSSLSVVKSNQGESQNKKEVSEATAAVGGSNNKVRVNSESSKPSKNSQRNKAHVQVADQQQKKNTCSNSNSSSGGGHRSRCQQDGSKSTDCPRCSRRSKSGTTTPATHSSRTRTPANRRVVQSCKSSTEIKKPIKSILKHDSRGSGSGSDKQSSMDSLGSSGDTPNHVARGKLPTSLMTRSDSGARARFNFNSASTSTPSGPPEDKAVAKLKRIEKYATLRMRKNIRPRPLDLSDSESNSANSPSATAAAGGGGSGKVGVPGVPSELMSKSMSYLEKSTNRVHISSSQGHTYGESTSASSTLKRHGSLRVKKTSSPQWEPSGTRTSALRLQKMQEAKAKNSPGTSSGSANSGSTHSGSGDSLHYLPHSANSTFTPNSSGMSSIHFQNSGQQLHHHHYHHNTINSRMPPSLAAAKEKHMGSKIFSKLSSALGQTASSNQKRLKQERGVQTETVVPDLARVSLSPLPLPDSGHQEQSAEQIKNLERLCTRYRNQCMKIQSDFEKAESTKVELQKQLEETQHESTEMIEFLQAEKSTLAESLTEVEVEAKKWKDEVEVLKNDYQSRCSSLVRLSEQHKQEALRSQALLHRMENQSTSALSQLSHQISDGAQSIHQTRQRVTALTESLLKTYKVPPELLNASEANQPIKETDLSCSLLLPLITSLSTAFPLVPTEMVNFFTKSHSTGNTSATLVTPGTSKTSTVATVVDGSVNAATSTPEQISSKNSAAILTESSSFQSLNQAILDREAAEKSGIDDIMRPFNLVEGMSPDPDQLSLKKEVAELNAAIAKLLTVVRVIVIHCDKKVSSVASSILQCLKSIDDDKKVGNMAEIAQVQKSLEAWSEKGISAGSGASASSSSAATSPPSAHSGSPPCKPAVTPSAAGESSPSTYLVGNGHAHV